MRTARFWTGTGLLTVGFLVGIVTMAPGYRLAGENRVEGRVWYKGQPVRGGAILFYPEDTNHFGMASALIDHEGRFVIGPGWQREGPNPTTFRISVIPDRRWLSSMQESQPAGPDTTAPAAQETRETRVLPASLETTSDLSNQTSRSVTAPLMERFHDPQTSGLCVQLGTESACIELDLSAE